MYTMGYVYILGMQVWFRTFSSDLMFLYTAYICRHTACLYDRKKGQATYYYRLLFAYIS